MGTEVLLTRNDERMDRKALDNLVEAYGGNTWEFEHMGWSQFRHDVDAAATLIQVLGLNDAIRVGNAPDGAAWFVEAVD